MSTEVGSKRDAFSTEKPQLYRPLNVSSWSDAFRVLIGWILVIVFSVVSGGLFVLYEVIKIHAVYVYACMRDMVPTVLIPLMTLP